MKFLSQFLIGKIIVSELENGTKTLSLYNNQLGLNMFPNDNQEQLAINDFLPTGKHICWLISFDNESLN